MTLFEAVEAMRAGDASAFPVIYQETSRQAMEVIRSYCGASADCDTLLQDTYVRVYQNISRLRETKNIQGWVNAIAEQIAMDHLNRQRGSSQQAASQQVGAQQMHPQQAGAQKAGSRQAYSQQARTQQARPQQRYPQQARQRQYDARTASQGAGVPLGVKILIGVMALVILAGGGLAVKLLVLDGGLKTKTEAKADTEEKDEIKIAAEKKTKAETVENSIEAKDKTAAEKASVNTKESREQQTSAEMKRQQPEESELAESTAAGQAERGSAQAFDTEAAAAANAAETPAASIAETAAAVVSGGDYIFPDSSTRALTAADVAGLSKEQLKIARNEIFARHGYIFTTPEMKSYFEGKSWYHGSIAKENFDMEKLFNQIEKDNVKLIKSYE